MSIEVYKLSGCAANLESASSFMSSGGGRGEHYDVDEEPGTTQIATTRIVCSEFWFSIRERNAYILAAKVNWIKDGEILIWHV
jgi:hypothetical protein